MTKLKDWARGRYSSLLRGAPARLRAEHFQRRFDGDRVGVALTSFRMAVARGLWMPEEDIFALYPLKRYLDRQEFEREIQSYNVVSFDVFDTLLFRRVEKPVDVFSKMEKECNMPGFAGARVASERLARERKFAAEGSFEVTIDEIYRMPAMYAYGAPEELIEAELAAERRCCYASPMMLDVFEQLRRVGKQIVVTSDMYLHAGFIRKLLEDCGYRGIAACFVSGDLGAGKGSGKLFDAVRKCVDDRSIIHIGDNFFSDVVSLRGSNIVPIHYLAGRKKGKEENR